MSIAVLILAGITSYNDVESRRPLSYNEVASGRPMSVARKVGVSSFVFGFLGLLVAAGVMEGKEIARKAGVAFCILNPLSILVLINLAIYYVQIRAGDESDLYQASLRHLSAAVLAKILLVDFIASSIFLIIAWVLTRRGVRNWFRTAECQRSEHKKQIYAF
jgi:hypothetical protein